MRKLIIENIDFSPDGKFVAFCTVPNIHIVNVETKQQVASFGWCDTPEVRFSSDGKTLALGYGNGTIVIIRILE